MNAPGLTRRLHQRSRRAGLAIGLTAAVAITLLIGSFTLIYTKLDPYLTDFVGAEPGIPTATVRTAAAAGANEADPTEEPTLEPAPTKEPANTIQEAGSTPTSGAFQATHASNPDFRINLRPGPSVDSGTEVTQLDPGTELQFLGDQQTDSDGMVWIQVKTQDGFNGWIREIDTVAVS